MQRRVGLRIEIDDVRLLPSRGQRRAQIDGGGGLSHAPFLIEDRDPSHDAPRSRFLFGSLTVTLCGALSSGGIIRLRDKPS